MLARLVTDALWRNRWIYVSVSAVLIPCWLMYVGAGTEFLEIRMSALSLIVASVLGPMVAIPTMGRRELRHIPVSSRDLWRTTWVVATVTPAGILLLTKMISVLLVLANGDVTKVPLETMLLSAAFDFTWAGVMLPLLMLLGSGDAGRQRRPWAGWQAGGASVAGLFATFGLPILVGHGLPTQTAAWTSRVTAVLIAGLAITTAALIWTPRRGVLAGEHLHFQSARIPLRATALTRLADQLTGVPRVILPHLLATVVLPLAGGLALAVYGLISGSGPWWFVPDVPSVFDPGDIGDRGLTYFVLLPCGVATMVGLWVPWTRLMKSLPLSVKQVNGLLLLTPFLTWTILWLLGWSAYVLAYGAPRTLRLEFAFGMAAVASLAHAMLLRVQGSTGSLWIIALSGGLMPQLVKVGLRDEIGSHVLFVTVGVFALCTAALVNHHTLTHSTSASRAYRRPPSPVGFPAAPGVH